MQLEMEGIEGAEIITAGFPCQDLSFCGKGAGLSGERSGLWWKVRRTIRMVRPRYAIMENVAALLNRGMGVVLGSLASIGYDSEWHCIQPTYIGIPSNRDRVWICAYPKEINVEKVVEPPRLSFKPGRMGADHLKEFGWAVDQSQMGRGVDGIPDEVDRFKALGNTIYPQIAQLWGYAIMEREQ